MDTSSRKIYLGATYPSEDALESSVSRLPPDDIAIIGMSCRTAGGNDNPEKLWKFLMEKGDASGISPAWRWDTWRHRNPRNLQVIDSTINKGYFINNVEDFDASFFGISPKEAEQMDPQQRMGLELTWEALEDAGIDAKKLARSDTAVFMGVYSDDYSRLLLEDLPNIEGWMGLGSAMHGVANRISYHFDFQGASAAVDAACASSMVAVDSGRQALLAGQCNLAIVGGVNVALSPAMFVVLQRAGALAPDGVCRSFDDEANGYVRGEGGAVLILKRLTDARADGDNVLCILKASAVAQDGKTNGIMAPNPVAQELVARKALAQAGLDPLSIGFVEAHATSTSLGDPTELASISAVYGKGRPPHSPALIGSLKPNVGHLEAAAGVISLVKVIMVLNEGQIPPQANLNKLTVKVDWPQSGLEVVRNPTRWGHDGMPRRAAVCSFGYGGTVTHAILEQSTQPRVSLLNTFLSNGPAILVLTAPQAKRISAQCKIQAEWIAAAGRTENLQEISSTLARRRAQHDIRAAFVVDDHMDAAKLLNGHALGEHSDWVFQGRTLPADVNKGVVWLFSGHGAQWTDMGKELVLYPGFLDAISAVERVVSDELGWSVTTALTTGEFSTTEEIQVLTYTTQIGLAHVLRSKGLRPQAVIGHSVGEIAASVAAGCITSEEGATIVARRARLYTQVCGMGGMYLVHVPFEDVATDLAGRSDIVAAINSSPSSCVVSGLRDPVQAYASDLRQKGVKVLAIKTDVAFHSPMLESLVEPLRVSLKCALRPQQSVIPVYSTSQKDARSGQYRDIDYWVQNMVNPVRLLETVTAAVADGYRLFVEVSTHPIIMHSVNETLLGKNLDDFALVTTMARHQPFEKSILRSIAQLYVKGADINFSSLFGLAWSTKVPGFAWSRKPFWKHVASPSVAAQRSHDPRAHSLLGLKTTIAGSSICTYETQLDPSNAPFPEPHMLHGTNILPAAAYVNTFFHAAGVSTICKIALEVPLPITDKSRTIQVVRESNIVRLFSRPTDSAGVGWVRHASAVVGGSSHSRDLVSPLSMSKIKARVGTNALSIDFATEALKQVGVDGMAFPWKVRRHYSNGQEMLVEVDNYSKAEVVPWHQASWAPTVDAATSISFSLLTDEPKLRVVSNINRITIHSKTLPPKVFWLYITETPAHDKQTRVTNVAVLDVNGILLVELNGVAMTEVHGASGVHSRRPTEKLVHRLAWVPARPSENPRDFANAILISRDVELRQRYCGQLASHVLNVTSLSSLQEAKAANSSSGDTAIIYCPPSVVSFEEVAASAQQGVCEVADVVRFVSENNLSAKIFVITNGVHAANSPTALSQAPLYGLARVAAGEHPDIWGGLIDSQSPEFPFVPFRYVQGQEVIQFKDGLPWVARLRPLATADRVNSGDKTLLPKPEGTYIVTGGLGDLGLETCDFLIEQGARRLVLISRRKLLARTEWATAPESWARVLERIQDMEKLGVTVHAISLDIAAPDAHAKLLDVLQGLSLPPVRGVVHAAGVVEDGLLLETSPESFERVLSPKVSGTLTLHKAFPPGALDFFILFSSVGQLIGLPGQSSYASANAFLDCLAEHRRLQGDNTISFLWTAWRSLGMGTSDFIRLECENRGISDIGRNEAFAAWEHMTNYDLSQCVVTPVLVCDQDEPVPSAILEDVVERRQDTQASSTMPHDENNKAAGRPTNQAELKQWINQKIRECVASVMKYEIDEIDSRLALSEMGVDSIMSVSLRQRLQGVFKIKIPQTLIWNYPTIDLQAEWLAKKMA